ncbi:BTB/POZ domain-containing protein [Dirofilaria immitis]
MMIVLKRLEIPTVVAEEILIRRLMDNNTSENTSSRKYRPLGSGSTFENLYLREIRYVLVMRILSVGLGDQWHLICGIKQENDRIAIPTNKGISLQDSQNELTSLCATTSCYHSSKHSCDLHIGSTHQENGATTAANSICSVSNLLIRPSITLPLGNMNQNDAHFVNDLSESFVEDASLEIENGYPLVADLQQLRLQNHIHLTVDDIIEQQQASHSETMGNITNEELQLPDDSDIRSSDLLERTNETVDNVTRMGPVVGPLHDVTSIVHNASSLFASMNRRLANVQDGGNFEPEVPDVQTATCSLNTERGSYNDQLDSCQYPLHNAIAMGRAVNDTSRIENAVAKLDDYFDRNEASGVSHMGWQASKSTLKERFAFLYCNEVLADIWFVVGRGESTQRIPAHKFILITGSAVFDAMFNGGLANSAITSEVNNVAGSQDIDLPDVEPGAFLALLKFLYTDDVSFGPEIVMTTLYTAKKYAVPAMELACVDFLKRNLGADNAFMLLTQARLFDEPQLASLCLDIIDRNTIEALNAEGFTEIDLDTLCVVLKRNTLRVREAPLFVAVLRWSVEECRRRTLVVNAENQRTVLGKALHMIRFPLMTIDEFAQHAAQTGILTDRELVSLFLYFTVNPKPHIEFLDVPRCCVFGKEVVVSRFQRVEGRWGYSGTPDRIKFTVDRRIYVIGFGLHGSIHGPHEYQVTIQILHCGTGKILASNDTSFSCDGSCGTFRVLFREPVEISPCVTYIASARLKGPDSHYGTKGLRRIVHQSPSTGVITFQFTYAAGNNNGIGICKLFAFFLETITRIYVCCSYWFCFGYCVGTTSVFYT